MALRRLFLLQFAGAMVISLFVPIAAAGAGDAATGSQAAKGGDVEAAFNSSKELGTAEAWNAFLANYPAGFHADLARAYLKKLTGGGTSPSPQPDQSAAMRESTAQEVSCAERNTMHSVNSDVPTKLTFVNTSGMYRALQWIDFKGAFKNSGGLNPGAQMTVDTFVTHPWMIATGPGDCLQIFMPGSVPATVELSRLAADDESVERPRAQSSPEKRKQAEPERKQKQPERKAEREPEKQVAKKKPLICGKNYKLSKGECVLVQNCGSNAYRSPEGDCYCNKNYTMKNGKCAWKQDKQGFEIAPWKKTGCKGWQSQCGQGNKNGCAQYEANCQVN
jgi:VHL beta domain